MPKDGLLRLWSEGAQPSWCRRDNRYYLSPVSPCESFGATNSLNDMHGSSVEELWGQLPLYVRILMAKAPC